MKQTNYQKMTVDELFSAMQEFAIKAYDADRAQEPIKRVNDLIDVTNEIQEEIDTRGHDAIQRYLPLVHAPHPAVRLRAALVARDFAQDLAVPVLEDISDGKYGGGLSIGARSTLDGMRKRGLLPPKPAR